MCGAPVLLSETQANTFSEKLITKKKDSTNPNRKSCFGHFDQMLCHYNVSTSYLALVPSDILHKLKYFLFIL